MDDRDVVAAERLRNELRELRGRLRESYSSPTRPVVSEDLRASLAAAANLWLVELEPQLRTVREIKPASLADRSVAFQRLLSMSEGASRRSLYEKEIKAITDDFTAEVVIPAKLALKPGAQPLREDRRFVPTAFVGHSFADADKDVVTCVVQSLAAVGLHTETGARPSAEAISAKVKRRIEDQHMFVGVFTRRDKIARRNAWTTSPWVIDEKAYALARGKRLILLKESGVESIGGLQADQEYAEFDRRRLDKLALWLISLFDVSVRDFRP